MPINKFVEGKLALWQFRAVFTQTDAGGGSIDVRITPGLGNYFLINTLVMGPDNYAVDRTLITGAKDENMAASQLIDISLGTVDNELTGFPSDIGTSSSRTETDKPIIIAGNDLYNINMAALAQNETVSLAIRAFIKGIIPTIDFSNSGGTVTQSTTVNTVQV